MRQEQDISMPEVPAPKPAKAQPVPPSDSFYERLAAPLPKGGPDEEGETPAEREARRLKARLGESYVPASGADLTFDPRIAYELALGLEASPSAVFAKYGVSLERAKLIAALPGFIATVKKYKDEIAASGVSFRLKAKLQAEDLLTHSYILATDPEVPAAVRADLIKWTAKMADLEPGDKKGSGGGGTAGFGLQIIFAGAAPGVPGSTPQVITVTGKEGDDEHVGS